MLCALSGLFHVAAVAVFLGLESAGAVVTFSAQLTGIDPGHGDLDSALFHFREHVGIMAFLAFDSGLAVNGTGKLDIPHRAFVKIEGLSRGNRHGSGDSTDQGNRGQHQQSFHGSILFEKNKVNMAH